MYYVYIVLNLDNRNFYTGYTEDLKKRITQHQNKEVFTTRNFEHFELVYYEACLNKYDAIKRERYLKSSPGKRYLKNRLKNFMKKIDWGRGPFKQTVRGFSLKKASLSRLY